MDTRVGVKRIDCGSNSGRGIAYRCNWSQFAKTNANSNRKFIAFDIDGSNHLLHLFAYFIILPFNYYVMEKKHRKLHSSLSKNTLIFIGCCGGDVCVKYPANYTEL